MTASIKKSSQQSWEEHNSIIIDKVYIERPTAIPAVWTVSNMFNIDRRRIYPIVLEPLYNPIPVTKIFENFRKAWKTVGRSVKTLYMTIALNLCYNQVEQHNINKNIGRKIYHLTNFLMLSKDEQPTSKMLYHYYERRKRKKKRRHFNISLKGEFFFSIIVIKSWRICISDFQISWRIFFFSILQSERSYEQCWCRDVTRTETLLVQNWRRLNRVDVISTKLTSLEQSWRHEFKFNVTRIEQSWRYW